jgi:flotillin
MTEKLLNPSFSMAVGMLVVFTAIMFLGFVLLLVRQYKRCPSNRVLVVYGRTGKGQASKSIHGGAAFVWPLIQDYRFLDPGSVTNPDRD